MDEDWTGSLAYSYESRCDADKIRHVWKYNDEYLKDIYISNDDCIFPYDVIFEMMSVEELERYVAVRYSGRRRCDVNEIRYAWKYENELFKDIYINNGDCLFPHDVMFEMMSVEELERYIDVRYRLADSIDTSKDIWGSMSEYMRRGRIERNADLADDVMHIKIGDVDAGRLGRISQVADEYALEIIEEQDEDMIRQVMRYRNLGSNFLRRVLVSGNVTRRLFIDNIREGRHDYLIYLLKTMTVEQIDQLEDIEIIEAVRSDLWRVAELGSVHFYLRVLGDMKITDNVMDVTNIVVKNVNNVEKVSELIEKSLYHYVDPNVLQTLPRYVVDLVVKQSSYIWDPRYVLSLSPKFYAELADYVYVPRIFMEDNKRVRVPRAMDKVNDIVKTLTALFNREQATSFAIALINLVYTDVAYYVMDTHNITSIDESQLISEDILSVYRRIQKKLT